MKNYGFLIFLVLLMAFSPVIQAQQSTNPPISGAGPSANYPQVVQINNGSLTASDTGGCSTVGACVVLNLGPLDSTANVQANGTWSGTQQIEVSVGNGQWTAASCPTFAAGAPVSSFTANGGWQCDVAGKGAIRVRTSAFTSGTAVIGLSSGQARSTVGSIPVPQSLSTTSTPTFAGVNQTTGNQFNGVTSKVFVTGDFTTSGVGTNLEQITGLSWTLPATTALTVGFHCAGVYQQNVGQAALTLGIQTTVAPTNLAASGIIDTTANSTVTGNGVAAISTATSTGIVTGTPAAQTTSYGWSMDGFIENPSTTASVVTINAKTATAADTITIKRGSYCALQF